MTDRALLERQRRANVEFFEGVLDWRKWVEVADELLVAADVLGERVEIHWSRWERAMEERDPAVFQALWAHADEKLFTGHNLLLAYVLENLLKALIVKRFPKDLATRIFERRGKDAKRNQTDYFDEGMLLPYPLDIHDLVKLASEAGLSLNALEEQLLRHFYRWSLWSARYHVPKKSKDMTERKDILSSNDPREVIAMIDRIRAAIKECPEPPRFRTAEALT
ncbi:MAG TPA: hypothetical protein VGS98_03305 [Thermoanaerobaculia bacterium]|jgi:hypothetical protein|nr:hypothetical protein [Thermoanaerobaculia bacterium]